MSRYAQLALIVFLAIAAYRFSLIDRGVTLSDELRYGLSFSAVQAFKAGDASGFCRALSSSVGPPI